MRKLVILVFVLMFVSLAGALPAFPGAEGFGANSIGGRGGTVIEVTNLNDDGQGSLRAAIVASGPRTVVFRTGGTIVLEKPLTLRNSYITIAGQIAPGGGITIRHKDGNGGNIFQFEGGVHDVVIRYLRMRSGKGTVAVGDIIHFGNSEKIIMDHISLSWSNDELIGINCQDSSCYNRDIGIQRTIVSEALADHTAGTLISGKTDYCVYESPASCSLTEPIEYWREVRDISLHHNLYAHNGWRNPLIKTQGVQFVNNLVYNWRLRIGSFSEVSKVDYVGNYFKMGPWVPNANKENYLMYDDDAHDSWNIPWDSTEMPIPSIYAVGNILEKEGSALSLGSNDWGLFSRMTAGYNPDGTIAQELDPLPDSFKRSSALPSPSVGISVQSASAAYSGVLADVGANKKLDCYGNLIANVDSIDVKILSDVVNNGGPRIVSTNPLVVDDPKHESFYGGFISVDAGTPCADADKDGMADLWENLTGLNINDASDRNMDLDSDGYTNLEEYINGQNPMQVPAPDDGTPANENNPPNVENPDDDDETECVPDWNCMEWNDCFDGLQTRTCTDLMGCGNENGKPEIVQQCEESAVEEVVETVEAGTEKVTGDLFSSKGVVIGFVGGAGLLVVILIILVLRSLSQTSYRP